MSTGREDTLARFVLVMRRPFPKADLSAIGPAPVGSDVQGWDSLSHALFIMGVEQEFGLRLPLAKVFELADVGALVDLIEHSKAPVEPGA